MELGDRSRPRTERAPRWGLGPSGAGDGGGARAGDHVHWFWLAFVLVAPGLMLFVLPAVHVVATNQDYFGGSYDAARALYWWAAGLTAIGVVLWFARRNRVGRTLFYLYALLVPGWVAYQAAASLGDSTTFAVTLAAVVGGACWLGARPRPRAMANLAVVVAAMLATTAIATISEVNAAASGGTGVEEVAVAHPVDESLGNVYHVVLDEFSTDVFTSLLDDDLRAQLGGFTWYPENTSQHDRTQRALASVFDTQPWDHDDAWRWTREAATSQRSTITALEQAGYRTTGWIYGVGTFGHADPFDRTSEITDIVAVPDEVKPRVLRTIWAYSNLPSRLSSRLVSEEDRTMLDDGAFVPTTYTHAAAPTMESVIREEASLPDHGRYTFVHLLVPHVPYALDERCREVESSDVSKQGECALALVVDLLDRLESLGRYDDATIVIQGDHGGRHELVDGELRGVHEDWEDEAWIRARSRALLLVKPAGRGREQPLQESSYRSMAVDVMPTIFDSVGLEHPPSPDRTSLLAAELPPRSERPFYASETSGFGGMLDVVVRRYSLGPDWTVDLDQVIEP